MDTSLIRSQLDFLAKNIEHLGHPAALEPFIASDRNAFLAAKEAGADNAAALEAKSLATTEAARSMLNDLHAAWVKAGQPLSGKPFLAGLLAGLEHEKG